MGRNPVQMAQDDYISVGQGSFDRNLILDNAIYERQLSDEEYIDLFEGFDWHPEYGGESWANIARANIKLKQIAKLGYNIDPNETAIWIDHIFDLAHNTGSLFNKMPVHIKQWMLAGLEIKKHAPPIRLLPYASPEVAKIMQEYMRLTGGVAQYQEEGIQYIKKKVKEILDDFFSGDSLNDKSATEAKDAILGFGLKPIDFVSSPAFEEIYLIFNMPSSQAQTWFYDFIYFFRRLSSNDDYVTSYILLNLSQFSPNYFPAPTGNYLFSWLREKISELPYYLISKLNNEIRMKYPGWWAVLDFPKLTQKRSFSYSFIKVAELTKHNFFDFYILNAINSDDLYPDQAKRVTFLRKYIMTGLIEELTKFIDYALKREARHVRDSEAVSNHYQHKYDKRYDLARKEQKKQEEEQRKQEEQKEQEEAASEAARLEEEAHIGGIYQFQYQPDITGKSLNWLVKISQKLQSENIKLVDECTGSAHQQVDCLIKAYLADRLVGYISYAIFEGNYHIQHIEVAQDMRRTGIATQMFRHLQELATQDGGEVIHGMTTPDGAEWNKSL